MEKKFSPKIYLKNMVPFYIVFSIFLVIGLLALLGFLSGIVKITSNINILNLGKEQSIGLIFFVISFLVIVFSLFRDLAIGSYYVINEQGITLSTHWSKKTILFRDISYIQKINFEEIEKKVIELRNQQFSGMLNPQYLTDKLNLLSELSDLFKYFTIPLVYKRVRKWRIGPVGVKLYKPIKISGEFIFLTTKDKKYFLSPKDTDDFLNTITNIIPKRRI